MIEKALQLREGLRKNPEMLVDSLTLKQIFVWLMDNFVKWDQLTVKEGEIVLKSTVPWTDAAAPDQMRTSQ
jgi:hypothetical protein